MGKHTKPKVDFAVVDMKSKTQTWTDDMANASFIQSDGKITTSSSPSQEPLRVNTRKASIRNSPFHNKFH